MPTNNRFLPIRIDATSAPQTVGVLLGNLRVKSCYWYNPAAIGDLVQFQTDLGEWIWQGRCEVQNQSQVITFPREIEVNGYQFPRVDSGVFYFYCV